MKENRTRQFRFSHGSPKPSDIGRVAFIDGGESNSTVQILPRVTKAIRHWSGGFYWWRRIELDSSDSPTGHQSHPTLVGWLLLLEEIELDSSDSPTGHQSHPIFIGWLLLMEENRTRQFRFSHGSPKPSDIGRVAFIDGRKLCVTGSIRSWISQ